MKDKEKQEKGNNETKKKHKKKKKKNKRKKKKMIGQSLWERSLLALGREMATFESVTFSRTPS